jgi:hypothetical protein
VHARAEAGADDDRARQRLVALCRVDDLA